MKSITFKIKPDGTTDLNVDGVEGSSCKEFSRRFEEALGMVEERELKDSYYQTTDDELVLEEDSQSHQS